MRLFTKTNSGSLENVHDYYIEKVMSSSTSFNRLAKELNNSKGLGNDEKWRLHLEYKHCRFDIILYTALMLEAIINFLGQFHSLNELDSLERQLSTVNKWIIYPQLIHGKIISDDSLNRIRKVFALRNRLVHYKPRIENDATDAKTDSFDLYNVVYLLSTVNRVLGDLNYMGSQLNLGEITIPDDWPSEKAWKSTVSLTK